MMRFQVLVDRSERINKCTILPLADHPAMEIVRYHRGRPIPALSGEMLLHPDGVSLDAVASSQRHEVNVLAAIDCTWKRLGAVLRLVEQPLPRLVRIPPGFVTAYPRRNKQNRDPDAGLATIEAVFIAAAFLGHWDESLLSRYAFGQAFLDLNRRVFLDYGVERPVVVVTPCLDAPVTFC
ncbi:MAG: DUF367 domain-containing protein [Deltaproteobacteria bacterium]|nr:DUF367 domain-containing protein [Deltaproteobacteria bacterium]